MNSRVQKTPIRYAFTIAMILQLCACGAFADAVTNFPALIEQLSAGEGDKTAWNAYAILVQAGDEAVPQLAAALADERKEVRMFALSALAKIRSLAVLPPLLQALRHEDKDMRRCAACYLGQCGRTNDQVLTELHSSLMDTNSEVVHHAILGLDLLGDVSYKSNTNLIMTLCKRLRRPGPDWDDVLMALDMIGTEPARHAAAETLTELVTSDVYPVPERLKAAMAFNRIAPTNYVPTPNITAALLPLISSDTYMIKERAVDALGIRNNSSAVPVLTALVKDTTQHFVIRSVASEALGRIGDPRAVPELAVALSDKEWRLRESAASALGGIKSAAASAALKASLGDEELGVTIVGVDSLGRIGDPRPARIVFNLLSDRRAIVFDPTSSGPNLATTVNIALSRMLQDTTITNKWLWVTDNQTLSSVRKAWSAVLEERMKKRAVGLIVPILIVVMYVGSYVILRSRHVIVHYWATEPSHSVRVNRDLPGSHTFLTTVFFPMMHIEAMYHTRRHN